MGLLKLNVSCVPDISGNNLYCKLCYYEIMLVTDCKQDPVMEDMVLNKYDYFF